MEALWLLCRGGHDKYSISRCALGMYKGGFAILCFTTAGKARQFNKASFYSRIYRPARYPIEQIRESANLRGFPMLTDSA